MSKENEKNLIEYLKEVEQLDSEFINLFYNIYLVGVYLCKKI